MTRNRNSVCWPSLPVLIAHRCNTVEILQKALRLARQGTVGCIECDVRTTRDGVLVVQHDAKHSLGSVSKMKFDRFEGKLLTLESWLEKVCRTQVDVHLDVKAYCRAGRWYATADSRQLLDLILAKEMQNRVIITAFAGEFLRKIRRLSKTVRLGVLYDQEYGFNFPDSPHAVAVFAKKIIRFHTAVLNQSVFLNQHWLRLFETKYHVLDAFVAAVHKTGIQIDVWTVNEPCWARYFYAFGIRWLTTDEPAKISRELKRTQGDG